MALTVFAVVLRKANIPFIGTQDISKASLLVMVFFALAYTGWTGGHIYVDLIGRGLPNWLMRIIDALVRMITSITMGVVAWRAVVKGIDAFEYGDSYNLLPIPFWPFFFVVGFGCALYAVVLALLAIRSASGNSGYEKP